MRKKNSYTFCLGTNADCSDIISKHQFILTCKPLITVLKFRVVFFGVAFCSVWFFFLLRNKKPWAAYWGCLGIAKGRDYFLFSAIIKPHAILAPLRTRNMLINSKKSRGGSQRQWRLRDQGSFSSKTRQLWGHFTAAPDLRGGYRKDSARLFTKMPTEIQRLQTEVGGI